MFNSMSLQSKTFEIISMFMQHSLNHVCMFGSKTAVKLDALLFCVCVAQKIQIATNKTEWVENLKMKDEDREKV